ncbi:hypothetical protein ZYGR_0U02930 [Zygosaccharomyces rouxii]|uniref:G-patch domain-containing protein n=1 Tax=Zygosaccharomyces rouxii TaxID=4956 RepID=A0A1Q3A443_ZYGRO|nr:hypothetical protein ZYGR_0U02930 [Zygosaccharomyces rouxii]
MAKRHNHYRGRGTGRGTGRGGRRHHGSSRGRGGGKFSKGKGRHQSSRSKGMPPLGNGDLSNPDTEDVFFGDHIDPSTVEDYYFGRHKDKSMSMGGFRPGQREEKPGSKLAFRKRPMAFVKAIDVYDPSHDLIETLRRENSHLIKPDVQEGDDENDDMQEEYGDESDDGNEAENEEEEEDEEEEELELEEEQEEDEEQEDEEQEKVDEDEDMDKQETSDVTAVKDEDLYVMDDEGEEAGVDIKSVHVEETDTTANNTEYDPTITVGKVQLSVKQDEPEESVDNRHVDSPQLSGTMGSLKICESASPPPDQSQDPQDPQELPFGMAEEDSLVDLSEISITNVRVGFADDSYFVKCFRMFGDHEPKWVDRDNLSDFILEELNYPEHRLGAYLQFIKDSLIKQEEPEPTYSDIPLSDSDSDEYGEEGYFRKEESVSSDMREGLDDLIAYTEKYNVGRNMEYETSTLNSVGKGKKKKLLIDESLGLDSATISTLEDKFRNRIESKANKRRTKQDFIDEMNQFSEDLFKKYPIGLHIQNIKDECEFFLLKERDRLSFPPLDPHGNNVVLKMSHHFNLKGYREGSGKGTHVVAQKTRATERYSPDYNRVHQLLRQRPVFYRIDVNRPGKTTTERFKTQKAKFHANEGEVVGQDAPAIGSDNVGRRMLEKLGWSNGEGLGARGNKGIAEPLMARVKKSKSGLKQSQEQ